MSDDKKTRLDEHRLDPALMYPLGMDFGERIGREMGLLAARVGQVEIAVAKLDAKIDAVEAKINAVADKLGGEINAVNSRMDKCLVAINRLDERTTAQGRAMWGFGITILAAVIAGLALQLMK